MRVIITASGIQEYIFGISRRKASARLRGRSARLGLVMDLCLLLMRQEFPGKVEEKRNAGSRLEVVLRDVDAAALSSFLGGLSKKLDRHSLDHLDGQVWFTIATSDDAAMKQFYDELAVQKYQSGRAVLQSAEAWNESEFFFERTNDERGLEDSTGDEALELPDAILGSGLARDNHLIAFGRGEPQQKSEIQVIDHVAKVRTGSGEGLTVELQDASGRAVAQIPKLVARYAPLDPEDPGAQTKRVLDFNEIVDIPTEGARFLGVLKADTDGMGGTFASLSKDEAKTRELSRVLERFFTFDLEALIRENYRLCYVVYSGGDDLFMVGPWEELLRFTSELRRRFHTATTSWGYPKLSFSAGFKLAHPQAPVRYLAEEGEEALSAAKQHVDRDKRKPKDQVAVFEDVLQWDELEKGLELADGLIDGMKNKDLSKGLLQRFQYYAHEFRRFDQRDEIDGLRAVPLLQNDWGRNIGRVQEPLQRKLEREVRPSLIELNAAGRSARRMMAFASRFALYAVR